MSEQKLPAPASGEGMLTQQEIESLRNNLRMDGGDDGKLDQLCDLALSTLSLREREGMVIVPIEPTAEMKREGAEFLPITPGGATLSAAERVWTAMLAAAPSAGRKERL